MEGGGSHLEDIVCTPDLDDGVDEGSIEAVVEDYGILCPRNQVGCKTDNLFTVAFR